MSEGRKIANEICMWWSDLHKSMAPKVPTLDMLHNRIESALAEAALRAETPTRESSEAVEEGRKDGIREWLLAGGGGFEGTPEASTFSFECLVDFIDAFAVMAVDGALTRYRAPRDGRQAAFEEVRVMLEEQRNECLQTDNIRNTGYNRLRADELDNALINLRALRAAGEPEQAS